MDFVTPLSFRYHTTTHKNLPSLHLPHTARESFSRGSTHAKTHNKNLLPLLLLLLLCLEDSSIFGAKLPSFRHPTPTSAPFVERGVISFIHPYNGPAIHSVRSA